ncbi:N-acetylmuramoyl-L-alanine amidase AmiA [Edwardsiella tarda]|uniref:N-acetylmuramoyl-L-alanine amidase AmiA n=1 Tax=Edwardsiella tarda TaxID=636 RepID=UPI003F65C40C
MKRFSDFRPLPQPTSRRQFLCSGLALLLGAGLLPQRAQAAVPEHLGRQHKAANAPRVIMLDPGHGGIDPGAVGHQGSKEKHVVLDIAHRVRDLLRRQHNLVVRLTREDDYFIPLYKRVEIAAQHQADLFVSIHADGFTSPEAAGASVFALSNRGASSAMAKYLSQRENDADKVAGERYAAEDNNYLQQVLFDLVQTDTIKNSLILGRHLLNQIRPIHRLHCQHTEQAAFAVLKSPAIPSVLVETAFITNHEEERLLTSSTFRTTIAEAIAGGIVHYLHDFEAHQRRRPA